MTVEHPESAGQYERGAWLARAGVRVIDDGETTRLRLRGVSPVMAFVVTLIAAAVVGGFAYPLASAVVDPVPPAAALGYVFAAVLVASLIARHRQVRIRSGREDLVIDRAERTLHLPCGFGRDERVSVSFDGITEITSAEELPDRSHKFDPGGRHGPQRYVKLEVTPDEDPPDIPRSTMVYAVVVCWRDESGSEIESPIVRWSSRRRTRSLVFWLRTQVQVQL